MFTKVYGNLLVKSFNARETQSTLKIHTPYQSKQKIFAVLNVFVLNFRRSSERRKFLTVNISRSTVYFLQSWNGSMFFTVTTDASVHVYSDVSGSFG